MCFYAHPATGKSIKIEGCDFVGGAQDTLYLSGAGSIVVESSSIVGLSDSISAILATGTVQILRDVTCTSLGTGTSDGNNLWLSGPGTILFQNSELWAQEAGGGNVRFKDNDNGDNTVAIFDYCTFYTGAFRVPNTGLVVKDVQAGTTGCTLYLSRCAYADLNYTPDANLAIPTEDMGDGNKAIGGDLTVTGGIAGGTISTSGNATFFATVRANQAIGSWGGLDFYDGGTDDWNVGLARGDGDDTLHVFSGNFDVGGGITASGTIDAATGFTINTVERISSTGEGKFVGLNTTATQWEYFDALSCANGDRAAVSGADAWMPDTAPGASCLTSATDEVCLYFRIPYQAGTVVTRLSVRSIVTFLSCAMSPNQVVWAGDSWRPCCPLEGAR